MIGTNDVKKERVPQTYAFAAPLFEIDYLKMNDRPYPWYFFNTSSILVDGSNNALIE